MLVCLLAYTITADAEPTPPTHPILDTFSIPSVSQLLGWVQAPQANICGGYYVEPQTILSTPHPGNIQTATTSITAHSALLTKNGWSELVKVAVTQPGRQLTADKAFLYRDTKTNQLTTIVLKGNVQIREFGKLMVTDYARLNLVTKDTVIYNSLYRLFGPTNTGEVNARGRATYAHRDPSEVFTFVDGTYTTCPPTNSVWNIKSKKLTLDTKKQIGISRGTEFYIKNHRVFSIPYFSFSLSKKRKTGFLIPTIGNSTRTGLDISAPLYLNLAPNYDALITPRYMATRGVLYSGLFRYITESSQGNFALNFIPNDKAFTKFQNSTSITQFSGNPNYLTASLSNLQSSSNSRGYVSFKDNSVFDEHWTASANVDYVTDYYYFQDLGGTPWDSSIDQLLNQATINYEGENWNFGGLLQAYETLHPINEGPVSNQYRRLPQINLNGDFPDQPHGFVYQLYSQYTYFNEANIYGTNQTVPVGNRTNLDPTISLPLTSPAGYFTPKLQLEMTDYSLQNQNFNNPNHITRVLPMLDLDAGLYFQRNVTFLKHDYEQTLEPRIFYLYVPIHNQNDIPVFDTVLPPFSYDLLFRTNRFAGIDRIGDANQVTLGMESRFLDSYTGLEKMRLSLGETYYFTSHHVCLNPTCIDDPTIKDSVSPLIAQLNYFLNPFWSANASVAWNPTSKQINNETINFQYNPDTNKIFNIGYQFISDGDIFTSTVSPPPPPNSSQNNFNRINVSAAWPINQKWSAIGSLNYNISHTHPQLYLYGLQYDSCCWAFRLVASRALITENGNLSQYDRRYYVQLQLKGLGNFGNNNMTSMLVTSVPGYQDKVFSH